MGLGRGRPALGGVVGPWQAVRMRTLPNIKFATWRAHRRAMRTNTPTAVMLTVNSIQHQLTYTAQVKRVGHDRVSVG